VVDAAQRFLDAVYTAHSRGGAHTPTAAEVDAAMTEGLGPEATDVLR